ncbi:unnamed protein product [Pleuronectes platessa]|uniref:Uncharacterized protein n=1 Tax=Pleuronectes platessa TaxID=8262 RepID=A0A9N7V5U5_PLEPL|nr:unnamed protein product [Pleuronectes platessa]
MRHGRDKRDDWERPRCHSAPTSPAIGCDCGNPSPPPPRYRWQRELEAERSGRSSSSAGGDGIVFDATERLSGPGGRCARDSAEWRRMQANLNQTEGAILSKGSDETQIRADREAAGLLRAVTREKSCSDPSRLSGAGAVTSSHSQQPSSQASRRR